jgi:hypothetical protein
MIPQAAGEVDSRAEGLRRLVSRTKVNHATWLFIRYVVIKVHFELPWNSSRYMADMKNESKSELYLEEYLRS